MGFNSAFKGLMFLEMPQTYHQIQPGFKRLRKTVKERLLASSGPSVPPPVCLSVRPFAWTDGQTDRQRRYNFLR